MHSIHSIHPCQSYVNVIDKGVCSTLKSLFLKVRILLRGKFKQTTQENLQYSLINLFLGNMEKHRGPNLQYSTINLILRKIEKHRGQNLRYSSTNLYLENLRKLRGNFLLKTPIFSSNSLRDLGRFIEKNGEKKLQISHRDLS